MSSDLYLVPFDFTEVSKKAVKYATHLAQLGGGRVMVTHVVPHKDEAKVAKIKLETKINDILSDEEKSIVELNITSGSIFNDIATTADATNASLIVMGTHGAHGLQKILGSRALKLVSSSSLPFLILNEDCAKTELNDIVMPFSFAKESVQVANFAASLASKFNAKVHLVGYKDEDEWLARDMKTNEVVVRRHFENIDIEYDLVSIPSVTDYEKGLLEYAKEIDADLIAAAYFSHGIKDLFHKFIQEMIENEHGIPVLTVNAVEVMAIDSGYSFITV